MLSKNSGIFGHRETKSSSRKAGEETPRRERPEEASSTTGSGSTEGSAKHWHQSQRVRTLSRGVEAARAGTPQNVSFDTPFLTDERVQSVKMNFFIEKTGNNISEEDYLMLNFTLKSITK